MNEVGKDTAVVAFFFGTLGLLGMMRGAEKLFFDCVKNFEPVMKAQNVILESMLPYIDKIADTGVHGLCIDTLYASGGIMSKKLWKKVEAETSKAMCDRFRDKISRYGSTTAATTSTLTRRSKPWIPSGSPMLTFPMIVKPTKK